MGVLSNGWLSERENMHLGAGQLRIWEWVRSAVALVSRMLRPSWCVCPCRLWEKSVAFRQPSECLRVACLEQCTFYSYF